ncbi:hypothetical protein [Aliagarivorans taiwanensis]|uniref:hypothetical protein n=1 Tax=Aliagarivorans taiwanensis TaxID=561966 RepID=UPI0003FB5B15|nr:hypothetical protein [Aliagarivorans taiwanensis]
MWHSCLIIMSALLLVGCSQQLQEPAPTVEVLHDGPQQHATPLLDYYLQLEAMSIAELELEWQRLSCDDCPSLQPQRALFIAYRRSPVKNPHRANKLIKSLLEQPLAPEQGAMLLALQAQLDDTLYWYERYLEQQHLAEQQQLDNQQLREQLQQLQQIELQIHERTQDLR